MGAMRILAIETSCDETAAAVVEGPDSGGNVRVLSNVVASQADLHARTAGVVPEVAARAHVEAVTFVVDDALRAAGMGSGAWGMGTAPAIDAVAATVGPGLRPALVIGESAARALAVAWEKQFLPVNHLAGHIAAARIHDGEEGRMKKEERHRFPAVVLIVSGGHTQLWRLDGPTSEVPPFNFGSWKLRLLGQTRDDAAGEAFDKIARLLGLPYPGGAALAKLAEEGNPAAFNFPRPMADSENEDFSFSGLKTAVYYFLERSKKNEGGRKGLDERLRRDVAASAQEAIVDVLASKTIRAAAREDAREVILTGGVAANARLRERLREALGVVPLVVPHPQYCTDNAAMIGAAAALRSSLPERAQR